MNLSPIGEAFIKGFEQCKLAAYPDPGTGGAPWTIGWGHTEGVQPGDTCTQAQADQWFREDVAQFERDVTSLVKVPIAQGQFDALVSFAYNTGSDIDDDTKAEGLGDSTLLRKLNAGDHEGARLEFQKWNKSGGRVMVGLTRRRAGEAEMFA